MASLKKEENTLLLLLLLYKIPKHINPSPSVDSVCPTSEELTPSQ